jgi:homoserine kinase
MSLSVRVPATSANLGPGFDALGVAVSRYCHVEMSLSADNHFVYQGEGSVPDTPANLVHEGFRSVFAALGKTPPAVTFAVNNAIPLARGLGSSSAALVAGAALADKHLGEPLGREGVFQLAARLEGHPDNVAPAVFGGFTVSAGHHPIGQDSSETTDITDITYVCEHLPLPDNWQLLFAVPAFELLTRESRAVLPAHYPRRDVVFTSSRTALWALAVVRNKPELLRVASQDAIHEPYREPLIANFARYRQALLEQGADAVYLSGAGPTMAAVVTDVDSIAACQGVMADFVGDEGRVFLLEPSLGYQYE